MHKKTVRLPAMHDPHGVRDNGGLAEAIQGTMLAFSCLEWQARVLHLQTWEADMTSTNPNSKSAFAKPGSGLCWSILGGLPLGSSVKQMLASCPVRAGKLEQDAGGRREGWASRKNRGGMKERKVAER